MSTLCPMYIILVYKPVPAYAQRREAAAAEREGVLRVDGNFVMPLQLLLTMYIIAAACPKMYTRICFSIFFFCFEPLTPQTRSLTHFF